MVNLIFALFHAGKEVLLFKGKSQLHDITYEL